MTVSVSLFVVSNALSCVSDFTSDDTSVVTDEGESVTVSCDFVFVCCIVSGSILETDLCVPADMISSMICSLSFVVELSIFLFDGTSRL